MNIEFQEIQASVKPWVMEHMRAELIRLHHLYPALNRVQIIFKSGGDAGAEAVCELDVPVFGSSVYIHRAAAGFEEVSRDVIRELEQIIRERNADKNEPPDYIVSSIDLEEETDLS